MLRFTAFILSFSLVFPAFAEQLRPVTQPAPSCEFYLWTDEHNDHTEYVRELEAKIRSMTQASRLRLRPTQLRGSVRFETALFNLAGGKSQQIVDMLGTPANELDSSYKKLTALSAEIATLQNSEQSANDAQTKKLVDLEIQFMAESQRFGENYGFVKNMLVLLESVAAGKGVPEMDLLPTANPPLEADKDKKQVVVMNLTNVRSVTAAKRVLQIIKGHGLPELQQLRDMFVNNKYALRAKLERDVRELEKMNRIWRKFGNAVAYTLMNGTEKIPYISEKMRATLLRIAGLQVKQFLLNFYLGQIQDIVSVTRVRTAEGLIVLINDEQAIKDQAKELLEAAAGGIGEDLLNTFARLPYHRESWVNLIAAVEKKAKGEGHEAKEYKLLFDRMTAAREAAKRLGEIPYVHEPANAQEFQLILAQAAYLAGTEEATRQLIWPLIQSFLH